MTALKRCSATVSSRSTLPTSSPRRWSAKQRKDGRSCQPSTGTLEPISRNQPVKHQADQHNDHAGALARDLPETALHVTSRRLTIRPSPAPLTCAVVWVG